MARTFQTPRVFADMTVRANIEFGLKFAGRGRASTGCGATSRACPGRCAMRQHPGADRPGGAGRPAGRGHHAVAAAAAGDRHGAGHAPALLLLDEVAAGLTEAEVEDMAR
jgi:branched-chain amino acid transport system ATP-binding protein